MEALKLSVDTSGMADATLARWARERIARDALTMSHDLQGIGVLVDDATFNFGLHFDLGVIMVRDQRDGTIYVPGPVTTLIGQTPDGRELLWDNGEPVYEIANPAAAEG